MRRFATLALCLAIVLSPSARAATQLVGGSDAVLLRSATAPSLSAAADAAASSLFGARPTAQEDEPFALDASTLASRVGAAGERNPFTLTILLIVFAGLTAFFARKRSSGRGLISA